MPVVGENQSYSLASLSDIAYGENGHYVFSSSRTGIIDFNNATFGDPIFGTLKKGYVRKAAGQVVSYYGYNAYGKRSIKNAQGSIVSIDPAGVERALTSYRNDLESSYYYARARMFSTSLGRFSNRDPNRSTPIHVESDAWVDAIGLLGKPMSYCEYSRRAISRYVHPRPQAQDGYQDGYELYSAYFIPNSLDPMGKTPLAVPVLMACMANPPCALAMLAVAAAAVIVVASSSDGELGEKIYDKCKEVVKKIPVPTPPRICHITISGCLPVPCAFPVDMGGSFGHAGPGLCGMMEAPHCDCVPPHWLEK